MPPTIRIALLASALAVLSGCAGNGGPTPGQQIAAVFKPPPPPVTTYELTPAELKLDCKKLTGRMQVRILQIRDFEQRETQSMTSRGVQAASHPVLGTNTTGGDPSGRIVKDRAMMEAYNRRLVEKKCKSFDLDAEMRPHPVTVTPTPANQPARPK